MTYKIVKNAVYAYLQSKKQREQIHQNGIPQEFGFQETILERNAKYPELSERQLERLSCQQKDIQKVKNTYFKDILSQEARVRNERKRSMLSACFAVAAGTATYIATENPLLSALATMIPAGFSAYFALRLATARNTEHNLTAHYDATEKKLKELEGQINQFEKDRDWGARKRRGVMITPPDDLSTP